MKIFGDSDDEELEKIVGKLSEVVFKDGEELVLEGEIGRDVTIPIPPNTYQYQYQYPNTVLVLVHPSRLGKIFISFVVVRRNLFRFLYFIKNCL
jgi:hypothetical protein